MIRTRVPSLVNQNSLKENKYRINHVSGLYVIRSQLSILTSYYNNLILESISAIQNVPPRAYNKLLKIERIIQIG